MTSHLCLGKKKKQTSTPASSLLWGIWKREPHQTSNAGNGSNWEKVCPGSEGCEEVVERRRLLCRSGAGQKVKQSGRFQQVSCPPANPPEDLNRHGVMSGQQPLLSYSPTHPERGVTTTAEPAWSSRITHIYFHLRNTEAAQC